MCRWRLRWPSYRSSTRRNRSRRKSLKGRQPTLSSCWTGPLNLCLVSRAAHKSKFKRTMFIVYSLLGAHAMFDRALNSNTDIISCLLLILNQPCDPNYRRSCRWAYSLGGDGEGSRGETGLPDRWLPHRRSIHVLHRSIPVQLQRRACPESLARWGTVLCLACWGTVLFKTEGSLWQYFVVWIW